MTDRRGQPVTGPRAGRTSRVRENGAPQQITTFAAGEFPLSVAVALDRSFSMAGAAARDGEVGAPGYSLASCGQPTSRC